MKKRGHQNTLPKILYDDGCRRVFKHTCIMYIYIIIKMFAYCSSFFDTINLYYSDKN